MKYDPYSTAALRRWRTAPEAVAFWARLVECWLQHPLGCPCKGT